MGWGAEAQALGGRGLGGGQGEKCWEEPQVPVMLGELAKICFDMLIGTKSFVLVWGTLQFVTHASDL